MCKGLFTTFCNVSYDILTILISIADVATDIIVMIGFYNHNRMIFFGLSLCILIVAQCAYSMAFTVRFNTLDSWGPARSLWCFCCLLPFASSVSFCIYLADKDTKCQCCGSLLSFFNMRGIESGFPLNANDSKLTKWIKIKLSKHLGFVLESIIEAFPQSLLQMVAIVYYQEANFVAIVSILLSMLSVTTKSLILSQGIEKYTFIFTWLCLVIDFYGIFCVLSWAFYPYDAVVGNQYFNIFGQMWMLKIMIGILPGFTLGLLAYFFLFFWIGLVKIWLDIAPIRKKCIQTFILIIFGTFGYCLMAVALAVIAEVLCYAIIAFFLFAISTDRISGYHGKPIHTLIQMIIQFLDDAKFYTKNDRIIRIIAINKAMDNQKINVSNVELVNWINDRISDDGYEALQCIKYTDLRNNCKWPGKANIFPDIWRGYKQEITSSLNRIYSLQGFSKWYEVIIFCGIILITTLLLPLFFLTKIFQILYPWIILFYLTFNNLLIGSNQPHIFQLCMLGIMILLQFVLLFMGIIVFRIHHWIWHIQTGSLKVYWSGFNVERLKHEMNSIYMDIAWYDEICKIVLETMGDDIGMVIMEYFVNIQLEYDHKAQYEEIKVMPVEEEKLGLLVDL